MKLSPGINKWGSAVLIALSALLVINLVAQYRSLHPKPPASAVAAAGQSHARAEKAASAAVKDLARYDPEVHFDALKALDARPLPEPDRNPFEFVGGAPPPAMASAAPQRALPPPPPPPPPLKAMGYNELPGGRKEAIITYNETLEMVHEGDLIGARFKVLTINPAMLVVEDGNTHQKIELPFPQS